MAKGVILCGGTGTRLRPATLVTNKHLIPIGATPMVLYPLSTLKSLGVTDIMVVSGGNHVGAFAEFLGDGSQYGVRLTYKVQTKAGGIAEALSLAREFVGNDCVYVILGDNVFGKVTASPKNWPVSHGDAAIFVTENVPDMTRFGVLRRYGPVGILEKPEVLEEGDSVVTGLYFYPPDVFDFIDTLSPSARGELEITDVNNLYLGRDKDRMTIFELGGTFWSDCGTPESLANTTRWALDNPQASSLNILDPGA